MAHGYVGSPDAEGTIGGILFARASATPDAAFVIFAGATVTYGEMYGRAERSAAALSFLGLRRGETLAVMLPNSLELLDLWFGCALVGAVLVPINMALKGEGLGFIAEHCDARIAVVDASVTETFEASVAGGRGPEVRVARDRADGWLSYRELMDGAHPQAPLADIHSTDLASILYTSGTTGLPKGVMNTHHAYLTTGYEFTQRHVRVREDDIFYTSLPLFHVNAQMLTTMGSIVSGRSMVLTPRFTASGFFDDIRRHNATVFNYIGAMLTMIFKQPERTDDRTNPVRLAVGGAAPKEVWPKFEERFGCTILEIYGLTETATYCVGSPPDDIRVGKIGRPVSWADVQVVRDDATPAPSGEIGEIVVRANRPNILFRGYYKNPEATDTAMSDGWFRTGDRGRIDDDGYLEFVDRLKDSIRRRGENISSYEVERVVNSHPDVAESAAVGVPSDLGEEEVMIVVVPADGAASDPLALVDFCTERMAAFMVPRYVKYVDALPKTATERVQKYQLRGAGLEGAWDLELAANVAASDA
jgi:crotonobetaine/carnitine-CoA ligase